MLDTPYSFRKASVSKDLTRAFVKSLLTYAFQLEDYADRKIIYIVEAELYDHNIYVVKYYPKEYKSNQLKYNILTKQHKASRIIATCLHIIVDIIKSNPNANIGFLGARTRDLDGNYLEDLRLTKRFRIYAQIFKDFFGPETFTHYPDHNTSSYLLINNNNSVKEVKKCAEEMFTEIYPQLFSG